MDLSDPIPIIKTLMPKVPLMGKTALFHSLGISNTSKYWDLKTEMIITVVRSLVVKSGPAHVAKAQKLSLKDPGIKGKMWVSKVGVPKPSEDDLLTAVIEAVDSLKDEGAFYTKPSLVDITAEWTGYRAGATANSPELKISEEEKYKEMMKEVKEPATVLYFHGGAHYLMDPSSHRPACSKLAKFTKGRVLSVRYRLAPQNPFPAALVDALLSYLYLLYPTAGSFHTPVEARHVVFSGDSAGGNLATSLLLLLLTLKKAGRKIIFKGQQVDVPLPGGVALNSPWMDITGSCPSTTTYAAYDYLPGQHSHPKGLEYHPDELWPVSPPRKALYADDDVLLHPLVSPLAATAEMWKGSCPVWIVTGWELLNDENRAGAARMLGAGVTVQFEEFEAMPHCFAMLLDGTPGSRKCFEDWAKFITAVTMNPASIKTRAWAVEAKTLKEKELDMAKLCTFSHEQAMKWMDEKRKAMRSDHPDQLSKL